MAKYVDGFVFSVPKKNLAAYKKMAQEGAKAWMKFGALDYKECIGDDVKAKKGPEKMSTFLDIAKTKPTETVWFSFITFKSRKHRDEVNKKVMAFFNEKYKDTQMPMPFEMNRMSYGGFSVEVDGK